MSCGINGITTDGRGAAVIEFALILPLFACLLYGMLGYGQYFLLAHSVQQLANDAARATVAGTTSIERRTLATTTVGSELARLRLPQNAGVVTVIDESGGLVTVTVRLDASMMPLIHNALAPMPDALIERRAVIRTGATT